MMNKRLKVVLEILLVYSLLALFLAGCGLLPDYRLKALMLVKPPNKLIYVIDQDEELDLSYGRIMQYADFDDGKYLIVCLDAYDSDSYNGRYFHTSMDLGKAGTYLISIAKTQWFSWKYYFQYTVQVTPPGEYEISTFIPEDDFFFAEIEPTYCENVTAIMLSPPGNIIYPVGYTGEIDLSGIVVKPAKGLFPKEYNITDLDYTLESDVDFNTPGSYIAKVFFTDDRGRDLWFCFTVAVAEPVEK